jgi:hypothetical protein
VQQLKDKLSEASVSHAMYPYHIIWTYVCSVFLNKNN